MPSASELSRLGVAPGPEGSTARRRAPTTLVAVLAMLAFSLLAAGPASAKVSRSFWGAQLPSLKIPSGELAKAHKGRVGVFRIYLSWAATQPTKNGPYEFSAADDVIGDLASRGIRVMPLLSGSPSYAEPTTATPPLSSASARSGWKAFLRTVVKRYGPGGNYWSHGYHSDHPGARPHPIKTAQVWNEPTLKHFFQPKPSARRYAKLLKISHQAIHGANRHVKVVLAGLPAFVKIHGWKFLNKLYRIPHVKRWFEVAAAHPYAPKVSQVRFAMNHFRAVIKHHHDKRTPLFITEVGWGSAHPDGNLNKGVQGQARILKKSFRLFLHNRRRWNLGLVTWFQWRDPSSPSSSFCSFCNTAGLLHANGSAKPSFGAFKHFTHGGS